jgi:hypothetical protein
MDKMLQWTLWLGQNVTVEGVNLDVTSRQHLGVVPEAGSLKPVPNLWVISEAGFNHTCEWYRRQDLAEVLSYAPHFDECSLDVRPLADKHQEDDGALHNLPCF